jgi:riboflavin biosynthesis pyrimidine reductase
MCTTIDGKILTDRWGRLPGPKSGASLFESTAATFKIGAWIVGTTTMKEFSAKPRELKPAKHPVPFGDHIANAKAKSFAIGIDRKAELRFARGDVQGDHVILCICADASDAYRDHLQKAGVSYLVCGRDDVDLPTALDKLYQFFGIRKLMLQGGGTFNGAMLAQGLVDEISQVIVPVVDGGVGVTGVFDIPGEAPKKSAATLKLISHKTLPGGNVWVRYRIANHRTK